MSFKNSNATSYLPNFFLLKRKCTIRQINLYNMTYLALSKSSIFFSTVNIADHTYPLKLFVSLTILSYLELGHVIRRRGPSQTVTANQRVPTQQGQQTPQDHKPHVILQIQVASQPLLETAYICTRTRTQLVDGVNGSSSCTSPQVHSNTSAR